MDKKAVTGTLLTLGGAALLLHSPQGQEIALEAVRNCMEKWDSISNEVSRGLCKVYAQKATSNTEAYAGAGAAAAGSGLNLLGKLRK